MTTAPPASLGTPPQPSPPSTQPLQVYYDGGCVICSREIAFYKTRARPHTIDWVNVNDPACVTVPGAPSRQAALARFHVIRPDGTLLTGAAAFAEIWLNMPSLHWLGRLVQTPPFGALAEGCYRVYLAIRKLWR